MAVIVGYADKISARPGETVAIKVSSEAKASFHADFVRIISADPNPDGPGMRFEDVDVGFAGSYPSRFQPSTPGSYGTIELSKPIPCVPGTAVTFRMQPRLLDARRQVALWLDFGHGNAAAVTVGVAGAALEFGEGVACLPAPITSHKWYEFAIILQPGRLSFSQTELGPRAAGATVVDLPLSFQPKELSAIVLAAERSKAGYESFFNGRLEDLAVLRDAAALIDLAEDDPRLVAWWDFGLDIPTTIIRDRGPDKVDGRLHNLPTRGVRGSRWEGDEMCWRHAPRDYAAIHFHEDDLYDCLWDTDFEFVIPKTLQSGVYGVRLQVQDRTDIVPIFVLPEQGSTSKIAVLFPTITYQVYANFRRSNFDDAYRRRREEWGAYPNHPAENLQLGPSTYDRHPDGSGVVYASSRRPFITMRPGFFAYLDPYGSGLRHLPADMHLVSWLVEKGIAFDVLTDHDLDREGVELLAPYCLVMTTTHPEYQTKQTLDAIETYCLDLGSFAYLGGNGFYWRVARSDEVPDVYEIRRAENGTRTWDAEPGEYYNALDGSYGGLWVRNDRPPQRLFGVGMAAQGDFTGSYYRRSSAIPDAAAWVFSGIDDLTLGDFGLSGGGAAGFELDCVDNRLGTPAQTLVLATSENHPYDHYICVPEKISDQEAQTQAYQRSQIRADLCLIPHSDGRFVFSVGSITFCGSLPHNDYDNNISRLLENVVRNRLEATPPQQ